MARTPSNMMPLGTLAPDFSLPNIITGKTISLGNIRGSQGTLVIFICNHCPFVLHIIKKLSALCNEFNSDALGIVAISSNDATTYPEDNPANMLSFAQKNNFNFPYLYDESQAIAKAYTAACTPDFFMFNTHMQCVYRGQFDDSRPNNNIPVTGNDLLDAMEDILGGKIPNPDTQKPSIGCNIKWKEN